MAPGVRDFAAGQASRFYRPLAAMVSPGFPLDFAFPTQRVASKSAQGFFLFQSRCMSFANGGCYMEP